MPIPTYRPRSISFFLAPYRAVRSELAPSPYDPQTSGIRPGTPAYPSPQRETGGPLTLTIHHDAGAASDGDTVAASSSSSSTSKDPLLSRVRIPFSAAAGLGSGLAGASLGRALGAPQNGTRNAVIGGVVAGAAGAGLAYWLATSVKRAVDDTIRGSSEPPPDAGAYDMGTAPALDSSKTQAPPRLSVRSMTYDPNYGTTWPGAPPAPSGAPPKPGEIAPVGGDASTPSSGDSSTTTVGSVDAKLDGKPSELPWGWIIGGGIAAIVIVGGVAIAASSSKRRRRARGR